MQVREKVIKLRKEYELLGRFLIIQGSCSHFVPKLEETIGKFEMAMVHRSLCAGDVNLLLTADKSNLMKAFEDVKAQSLQDIQQDFISEDLTRKDSIEEVDATIKVFIIDAMAVLQCMKKNTMQTLSDLQDTFNKPMQNMMSGYDEVRGLINIWINH